jgi:hypothetical protein
MPTREEVFKAINSERKYQEKWDKEREDNPKLDSYKDKDKSIETWILWMEEYLSKARTGATNSIDKGSPLENIRKVIALGVACMEYHGAPTRYEI